jgi:Concanavalin A-like lectin/glucanases superfamily
MQSLAVNGFTAAEILAQWHGSIVELRTRFELYGFDDLFIRELTNVALEDSEIVHNTNAEIKRTARFRIREAVIDLDPYATLTADDGPLFYWRFGESSGTVADDASGNGRAGTINGSMAYDQPSLLANATENTSFKFNGTDASVSIADASWMDVTTAATWEAWIKVNAATASTQNILARNPGAGNQAWQFGALPTSGLFFLNLFFDATNSVQFLTTAVITDGLEHHIVATYDGAYVRMYVDSVQVLKAAETRTISNVTATIRSGSNTNATAFLTGVIDEVAFYNRALSSTEIREHYQSGSGDLSEIDFYRDRIKVYKAIRMDSNGTDGTPWAEFARGVFLLEAPDRDSNAASVARQVDGFDKTLILRNNATLAVYSVASGVNIVTAVGTALTAAGVDVSQAQLTPTTKTTASIKEWPTGTTYLRIINDLLDMAAYRGIRFDQNGHAVVEPYVLPKDRASEFTYEANETSAIIEETVRSSEQTAGVPNVVILSRANPDTDTLTSIQTNSKVSSPTSTVRRGFSTVLFETVADAADQTALDSMAKRRLTEASSTLQAVEFYSLPAPWHADLDKFTFIHQDTGENALNIRGDFIETEWHEPMSEIGDMFHRARLSVDVT